MAFDLETYQWRSARLDLTGLDWDRAPRSPLPDAAIDALLYMMDIEGHTTVYLSELLVSKVCMDPSISGFLHVWAYEEMFQSLALRRFLTAYGVRVPDERQRTLRASTNLKRIRTTLGVMVASHLTDAFAAVYLTIGAINELSTLWGYQLLAERAGHPLLTELLHRIGRQERQHYAFYRSQAAARLARSAAARALTRRYLDARFVAVGAGEKSRAEVARVVRYLYAGEDGRAAAQRIDEEIGRLPGLRGAYLARRTLDRARARGATLAVCQTG